MDPNLEGRPRRRGFTLLEVLIVIGIIALLAALVVSTGSGGASKRQLTQSMKQSIETALESYHSQFGEYPEPANPDETAEVLPGKIYRIGAAKCLYQALRGDGIDAIQGAANKDTTTAESDGKVSAEEAAKAALRDMPDSMWRKVGGHYILVDAFGRPFQYVKANGDKKNTNTTSYDLWSYAEDDKNILATSKDTEGEPKRAAKWIKNW